MKNTNTPIVFDEVMNRMYAETGTRTQVEMAEVLEIRQSSISDAKGRNSVPSDWLLKLWRKYRLNPDWLLYGVGARKLIEDFSS